MELKVSSPKPAYLPSDCNSDPEENEISEEDDDDRNHKHRRRELHSQSEETEAVEPVFNRPFRKRKPFENGHPYGEGDSQLSESRFQRRRGMGSFPRAPPDSFQRMRFNQSLPGDAGNGRGRARELSPWGHRDSRFGSVDIASQLFPHGPVTPGLFTGRGVQNVSNAQSSSWGAFGMVPGVSNGSLDTLHSLGFQGTLRPSLNPVSMGIPRQRCRDFEERGFCLRGDMCPMEHGLNRIVVEDVQSLSQFNLPVSLPNAHLLGPATGPSLPVIGPSGSLGSGKALLNKSSKTPVIDDGLGVTDAFVDGSMAGGADFYDPDQPLWSNERPETSAALQVLNRSKLDDTGPLLDADSSDHDQVGQSDAFELEHPLRGAKVASGSKSMWERIRSSKNKLNVEEKTDCTGNTSNFEEIRKGLELSGSNQGISRPGKQTNLDTIDPQMKESSSKPQINSGHNMRKPSQKALRTVFVRGIPQKDNKPDALLSHFQKFGEVIDIHIPLSSDRAFVQFSKRDEAEAALKAPDAVMGNRFIKLFWANRDNIMDERVNGGINVPLNAHGVTPSSVPHHLSVPYKGKDSIRSSAPKIAEHGPIAPLPTSGLPKPVANNGLKASPAVPKKVETLELLKEELRKKQELLDQKRNEFRRQLDKLQKQAVGVKAEAVSGQDLKEQKEEETVSNSVEVGISSSTELNNDASSTQAEAISDSCRSTENAERSCSISSSGVATPGPSSLKQSIRPLAPHGAPFIFNRYKLDNRPTAFKVLPPMPSGLANVAVLKEHFSSFGDLPSVELEDLEPQDGNNGSETLNISARICFPTRRSAEKAFSSGKIWQGQALQFMWLQSCNSTKDIAVKKDAAPVLKQPSDANVQPIPIEDSSGSKEGNASGVDEPEKSDIEPEKQSSDAIVAIPTDSSTRPEEGNAAGIDEPEKGYTESTTENEVPVSSSVSLSAEKQVAECDRS